ncbi:MAG TPA: UDP-N-acetylglucosamine 2-epimerase (non-hydrolyzing) [Longimicrobium sp.]|nr:UDP-N-acetylglucosamine 2-epimerase (non-hydrolyzing) [Longimicrobium sp.]
MTDEPMRVMTVVGTRPEIIRLSRTIPRLDGVCEHTLVHTGQNFSDRLSRVFFDDLRVRDPDVFLGVDTSSFGRQLATLFEGFERVLDERRPHAVLVLGDTNSALVAYNCKRRGIPVYHMEAGNRCYDDRVPEEVNRRVIDHCSAVLMPYTERSAENLVREGIERHRIFVTGNPIYEVLADYKADIDASDALERHGLEPRGYLLATLHRAENVDGPAVLDGLCEALRQVAELYAMPLVLSVHPRVEQKLTGAKFEGSRVVPVPAMRFFEFVKLQQNAALVLSDSGTVQEESAIFRVPVLTLRDTTERPETMEVGSNLVASTDPRRIVAAARFLRAQGTRGCWNPPREYVEENVSERVVRILLSNPVWASAGHAGAGAYGR